MLVPLPCSDVKCIALLQISSQDKEMLDMLQILQWILVWSTYISDELRVVISCGLKLLQSLSWDALLFYARLKKLKARMYSISVVVGKLQNFSFYASLGWIGWFLFSCKSSFSKTVATDFFFLSRTLLPNVKRLSYLSSFIKLVNTEFEPKGNCTERNMVFKSELFFSPCSRKSYEIEINIFTGSSLRSSKSIYKCRYFIIPLKYDFTNCYM